MKNFIRKIENFRCEKCGAEVKGDGYTDHCPKCLWGKHVDKDIPGDRASECRGMMEPIGAVYEKEKFKIQYRCEKCGREFWVREGEEDDRNKLIELIGY
jgi:ribosomal protein L37AE/L43A